MITLTFSIHARRVFLILAAIAGFLALQSIAFQYLNELNGEADDFISVYAQLTNSNLESSIPTWYATALLLFCAILLGVIALAKRVYKDRYTRQWIGLAIIFLYMSLDEGAMIHEELTDPMRAIFNVTNYLYFAWMIAGVPLALFVTLLYSKFVFDLPPRIRRLFILAGISYISGAVVIEAFSANMWYLNDGGSLPYMIVGTIEEFFEMLGAITLIYALLLYIEQIQLSVNLNSATQAERPILSRSLNLPHYSWRQAAVIALIAGFSLALLEWMLMRELSALPLDSQLVIPILLITTLFSLLLGFRFANAIPQSILLLLGMVTLLLHVTMPFWIRLLMVMLDNAGAAALTGIVLSVLSPLIVAGFFGIILPYFGQGKTRQRAWFYILVIIAAAGTVSMVIAADGLLAQTIYALYAVGLNLSFMTLRLPLRFTALLFGASMVWIMLFPQFNNATNALLFRSIQNLPAGTQTLSSIYSYYQKVDVLQSPEGDRYFYLDGRKYFDSNADSSLNSLMGAIPAILAQPGSVLVIGSSSMYMERLIAPHAGHVTTVEMDPIVVRTSMQYFDDFNLMSSLPNRSIIIDNPEHYVAVTDTQYDMVSTGAFIPINMTAFHSAIEGRLAPGGVLIVDLKGDFATDGHTSWQAAASLTNVFHDVMIITLASTNNSVAYAADKLPFTRDQLSNAVRAQGETQFTIFDSLPVRAIIEAEKPSSAD